MTPSISDVESKLKLAIAQILETVPRESLGKAFKNLSESYRNHDASKVSGLTANPILLSYIGTRMPATFAVLQRVLSEYLVLGGEYPKSMIDVGAGPATASFAAVSVFGDLTIDLIEKERGFQKIAKDLAARSELQPLVDGKWHLTDVATLNSSLSGDICIASYSLGEMPLEVATKVAKTLFASSRLALIIVEPGTPVGFSRIRDLRNALLEGGAHIAAPCPHQKSCPMSGNDFCHFSQRLLREDFHRITKDASLPYEDEKFSYLIVTKKPLQAYEGRLIKKPIKSSGHVTLDICRDGNLVRTVIARSNKAHYKTARKSQWGDRISLN